MQKTVSSNIIGLDLKTGLPANTVEELLSQVFQIKLEDANLRSENLFRDWLNKHCKYSENCLDNTADEDNTPFEYDIYYQDQLCFKASSSNFYDLDITNIINKDLFNEITVKVLDLHKSIIETNISLYIY